MNHTIEVIWPCEIIHLIYFAMPLTQPWHYDKIRFIFLLHMSYVFYWPRGHISTSFHYHNQIGSITFLLYCLTVPWLFICCGRTMIFYVKLIGYIIAPLSHALVDTLHYLVAVVVQLFKALKIIAFRIYFVECVSEMKSRTSNFHVMYGAMYYQSFLFMIVRISHHRLMITIKSEIRFIRHRLGLGYETILIVP